MSKFHYEIIIDLTTLKAEGERFDSFYGNDSIILYLDTNNRLVKDEFLTVKTFGGALLELQITKINRRMFRVSDESRLIEMDMTNLWDQENKPINTTDEAWFYCRANALEYPPN